MGSVHSDDSSNEPESSDTENDVCEISSANPAVSKYISTVRPMSLTGVRKSPHSFVLDGVVIDIGSSILSTLGQVLLCAAQAASGNHPQIIMLNPEEYEALDRELYLK